MKVRMLETAPGAPDGLQVHQYDKGEEYDKHSSPPMSDSLADVLIRGGLAEAVNQGAPPKVEPQAPAPVPPETQAVPGAPETQAVKRTRGAK